MQGTTNKQTGNSAHTLVRLHSTLTTEASHLYHTYNSKILWTGIETFAFIFSAGALQWLHGTTTDDDGREIGNFTLFADLLARMALADGTAKGFHRPLTLSVGQAQYSEEQLSTQWNMGRKRIRRLLDGLERLVLIDTCRSRVASVMTFPCLLQWMAKDGSVVSNPFIHKQRERIEPLEWQQTD